MKIGNIEIGGNNPVLVIPEIGINHEGSLQVAKEMALAAKKAGARLIKHQTHIVNDEMSGAAKKVIPGNADVSIYDIMERCALSEEEELEFKRYVESIGMEFISTPFSRAAADRLEKFGVKAYKIGSGEMNNYPLIKHIAEFGKPMIVSTGMNDIKSVAKAVNIMERYGVPYALMHTTNLYPTPTELVRLGGMQELMKEFKGVPIGLSDHTINNNACIAAMALGATIVERHFTDVMERTGPDIVCSMDENALKDLLVAAREVPKMLGGTKGAAKEEQVTIDFAFATVVTIAPVKKGEVFTKENLWVKRPGTGEILAEYYEDLLGKTAACDIDTDVQLERRMIAE
ncbi:MAG: polyhydroxyalkanoate biosynthesis repressor PhaR [Lachnospira sp.]|nr:polyhydroxyalkanoate biosynthesis repressor PhaR [Lachnospira sp.]